MIIEKPPAQILLRNRRRTFHFAHTDSLSRSTQTVKRTIEFPLSRRIEKGQTIAHLDRTIPRDSHLARQTHTRESCRVAIQIATVLGRLRILPISVGTVGVDFQGGSTRVIHVQESALRVGVGGFGSLDGFPRGTGLRLVAGQIGKVSSCGEGDFGNEAQSCRGVFECYEVLEVVDGEIVGGFSAQARIFLEGLGGAIGGTIDWGLGLSHAELFFGGCKFCADGSCDPTAVTSIASRLSNGLEQEGEEFRYVFH